MNGKFFDLKKEKQDRMINAALKVFALNGFRHASTDEMVQEAGISKGLLFHYFGSKLGAYTFVYDYSVRYMSLELRTSVGKKETDLFEIMKQVERARMHALSGYPYMQMFLDRSLTEDVAEALMAVEDKKAALSQLYDEIHSRIDGEHLPAGVDKDKLARMLELTSRGLINEHFVDGSFQAEDAYRETVDYIDSMKKWIYR